MKLMVFDVGGTEIKYSIIDENLNMENSGYVPTPLDTFEEFSKVINDIYQPHKDKVEGIAMSLPGFVSFNEGVVKGGGRLQYNWGRNVAKELSEICACKVVIENDGKAAARAEYSCGSLKGCVNAAVFIIGTGVGGGIIVDGKLLRGIHETAGEYSFLFFNPDSFEAMDKSVGYRCSTTGLLGRYKQEKNLEEEIHGRRFFEILDSDEDAQRVLDSFSKDVAAQIYNLFWLLDIEKVAIGGGISRQDRLINKIKEKFDELVNAHPYVKTLPIKDLEIVRAMYSNDANQIGAYMAYLEKNNS